MNTFLSVIKFILAVLALPVAWASASEFHRFTMRLPGPYEEFFYWGMFGFVLLYVFFYQFWGPYELGQKIIAGIFQFTAPANRLIAHIIPFYLSVILLLFAFTLNFLEINAYDHYFMFFAGFAFTMHIILTADELQEAEKAFIKPTYLLTIMLVLTLMICVTVLLCNLVLMKFTYPDFAQAVIDKAWDIYIEAYNRLAIWK
ncbi:MAG: hypothetical protein A3C36_05985 [Omnitrophica WOR_2 bacterium RIFCSPHIGHO2_02_FULL_52_10]|nr:MAG: hypothetical protein A3C36_05985 [Omnitrophica WOR_2 bacterium RIFCSPHIGHO2_02_FULL_52_10]